MNEAMDTGSILSVNSGSSSLKLGYFVQQDLDEQAICEAIIDGIGEPRGGLQIRNQAGEVVHSRQFESPTSVQSLQEVARWLGKNQNDVPVAVGHRVVHGGPRLSSHQAITPQMLGELERAVHFAPLHIPTALRLIREAEKVFPGIPQFACFDTAFHRDLPEKAARFALPQNFFQEGIRRYGFHGLSYESILKLLGKNSPKRMVIAHLGNGASLAAIQDSHCVDTTMGLTPTGGIPMSTRSGDLDPGVILYLLRNKSMNADKVEALLNRHSGLAALSGGTADMRDLKKLAEGGDAACRLAIEVFATAIRKTVAAFAAILGGLDLLVFTGGIGEHDPKLRASVCAGLDFMGISLNVQRNSRNDPVISVDGAVCEVRVMPSQEDLQIARHCRLLLSQSAGGQIA
jgi:acetate kinase